MQDMKIYIIPFLKVKVPRDPKGLRGPRRGITFIMVREGGNDITEAY